MDREQSKKRILNNIKETGFFHLYKMVEGVKRLDNSTKITLDNWTDRKEAFVRQNLSNYPESLPHSDRIVLELLRAKEAKENVFILAVNKELADLYIKYLGVFEVIGAPKSSLKAIALKMYYEGIVVSNQVFSDAAKAYGHSSGHKLMQEYNKYRLSPNRIGDAGSKRKLSDRMKKLNEVVELLEEPYKQKAVADLKENEKLYQEYL